MKKLWLSWYSLLLVCAILGFLPEPGGFWKFLCVSMSVLCFVPGGLLVKLAGDRQDRKTLRVIRNLSIISLSLTVVLWTLNVLSTMMSQTWGYIFNAMLIIFTTPMVCAQYWVLSLFGWSMLLWGAITLLKKGK